MPAIIVGNDYKWLDASSVQSIMLTALEQWSLEEIGNLYETELGTMVDEDLDAVRNRLARMYARAYENVRHLAQSSWDCYNINGSVVISIEIYDDDANEWDAVSPLFNAAECGHLPESIRPGLDFDGGSYLADYHRGYVNMTTNPHMVAAFAHAALTHPDPAVRTAMVEDPAMVFTVDQLAALGADPDHRVREAASTRIVSLAQAS